MGMNSEVKLAPLSNDSLSEIQDGVLLHINSLSYSFLQVIGQNTGLIMNSAVRNVGNSFLSFIQTQFVPVRYRYYADRIAKGPYSKKFGYKEKILRTGLLPRLKDDTTPLPTPVYRPGNPWTKEKAYEGQNDYIDLLGGGRLKPFNVSYDVPAWLRGRKGNELKLLILKRKVFYRTKYEVENPTNWSNMTRRINYLYRYLNRKTKTGFTHQQ